MKAALTTILLTLLVSGSLWAGDELPLCEGVAKGYTTCSWTQPDGLKYVGDWKDGKEHGTGAITYPNGEKYVGDFKDGNMHGFGTFNWTNGEKYVGEYKDNNRSGKGTYTYPTGEKYVGGWQDGKQHGFGTLTRLNGKKYVGDWKDGNKHGTGAITYPNGEKYIGDFKDGLLHGFGEFIDFKGVKTTGYYKEGEKITASQYFESLEEETKPLNKSIKLEDYYLLIALIVLGLFFFIYLNIEAKKKENVTQVDDEEEHDAEVSEESEILNVNETAEKEILAEADSNLPEQRRLFFGLSIRGWSWIFVGSIVAGEIVSELSMIANGYSPFFFFDRPRFTFENNLVGIYWASVASVIYLLFDYLKPKFKKQSSKVASNETELTFDDSNTSKEDKLKKLKDLYDKELISKEVYEKQQLEILSE